MGSVLDLTRKLAVFIPKNMDECMGLPKTHRFLHRDSWSFLDDAWSWQRQTPYTIILRDDL